MTGGKEGIMSSGGLETCVWWTGQTDVHQWRKEIFVPSIQEVLDIGCWLCLRREEGRAGQGALGQVQGLRVGKPELSPFWGEIKADCQKMEGGVFL